MLHPDIEAFLDLALASQAVAPFHRLQPHQARTQFQRSTEQMRWTISKEVSSVDLSACARDGAALPLRLYRPKDTGSLPEPVLVFFHGGGFVVGSLDSHDGVCRELCARSGVAVLAVGYRLAPEHRFPTALEDGEDALAWLAATAHELELDLRRVAFGGDSAGATLATVLAIQAAQQDGKGRKGNIRPIAQLLCYPVVDASRQSGSRVLFDEGYLLEGQTLDWFYDHYARSAADRQDWRFSPLLAPHLSGVAPTIMVLAGFDPLLDEGQAYARRLQAAGVAVEIIEVLDMTHDLLRLGAMVADVFEVYERIGVALARLMGSAAPASDQV